MNSRLILKVIALILVSNFIFSSEFIVRNAKVHSSSLKDLEGVDLHIKDGKFLAIEKNNQSLSEYIKNLRKMIYDFSR